MNLSHLSTKDQSEIQDSVSEIEMISTTPILDDDSNHGTIYTPTQPIREKELQKTSSPLISPVILQEAQDHMFSDDFQVDLVADLGLLGPSLTNEEIF